jgi:2-dehydro-3-deoxyphosphogluconate aldolase / (4S)-4-hydroxy-2-oxoglutarate aldolase
MTDKDSIIKHLLGSKVLSIIRHHSPENLPETIEAIATGGVKSIEITANTPGFAETLKKISSMKGILPGAGTVLDVASAKKAVDAGARYLVSPICPITVAEYCRKNDIVFIPGTFTPTEIVSAREQGGDIIKVFPAVTLGPGFFKALRGPLKNIPIMATGGIDSGNAPSFLEAGADMIGVGTNLFGSELIDNKDYDGITEKVRAFLSGL